MGVENIILDPCIENLRVRNVQKLQSDRLILLLRVKILRDHRFVFSNKVCIGDHRVLNENKKKSQII